MYYYYKDNQYVGCGNEPTAPAGCEARETGPTLPLEPDPKIQEYLSYLTSTDWYYARLAETGKPVPLDVVAKRLTTRGYINELI